jgi:arylsulfatase A-like enzyme
MDQRMIKYSRAAANGISKNWIFSGKAMLLALAITGICAANPDSSVALPEEQAGTAKPAKKPNIILLVCDDLNDSLQGFGGHPQAKTPNLDRLRHQGVAFFHAYTNVPLCGPSRASFLSGLYPHTTGYYSNKNNWRRMRQCPKLKDAVTIMEHFWNHGYDVYGSGKINHNLDEEPAVYKKQDGTPTYAGNLNWGPWPWDGKSKEGYGGRVHPSLPKSFGVDVMFAPLSDVPSFPPDPDRGIPGYTGWRLNHKPFRYVSETDRDLMPDERSARYAAKVIAEKHDAPYLLCVGFNRPHAPLIAPKRFFDMFPVDSLKLPNLKKDDLDDCAKILARDSKIATGKHGFQNFRAVMDGGGLPMLKRWLQAYLACVAFADAQIGVVLDALEKSPDRDNTYVLFVSDNGYHFGEKETLFKMTLWEEAGRIPFIVAGPGLARGGECILPVSLIDLYPTMIDLCGLPKDPNKNTNHLPLDGHSLKPLLIDPRHASWDGPKVALTEIANDVGNPKPEDIRPSRHHYAVRSERFRYILCNNGEEELYDHWEDPSEWTNLANDPKYQKTKQALRKQILTLTHQKQP